MYESFSMAYDSLMCEVDYKACADFIYGEIEKNAQNGILLDLACGTGTLSELIAKKGYDLICVDSSSDMLSVARDKLPDALFLCQKMQELDLYGTVSAAMCTLDSLNHLTGHEDLCKTFSRISLFLEPGGVFVFDVNTLYKHQKILANNTFIYDLDDIYCVWQNETEGDITQISLDIFINEGDVYRKYEERFVERGYKKEYIERILSENGFELIGVYDGYDKEKEPNEQTERLVFTARKI